MVTGLSSFIRSIIYSYVDKLVSEELTKKYKRRKNKAKRRPKSRGRWAEKAVATYFRKHGCAAVTNVHDVREIDVVGVCSESNVLYVFIVEVKSGRQLVDTPVLSRLKYIVRRISNRKTPFIRTKKKVREIRIIPLLVIGPKCALTPQAEEYAIKHSIPVYRYATKPEFHLQPVIRLES